MSQASEQLTKGARVRAGLKHPLIDGDSHIIEYTPVLLDFIEQAGGKSAVERFFGGMRGQNWYKMSDEERRHTRAMRGPWWALPTRNTLDRCTAMLPRLYYERMDDFGLDFMVLYPTQGLFFGSSTDDENRQTACHAYNEYISACYAEFSDRMTPAAMIPLYTPEEGIRELEHAHGLGLKVAMIPSYIRRPVPRVAQEHPDLASQVTWLDSYAIDSEHDYDPFWARCEELGFAVAAHSGGMGFDDRRSMSNYMYNHMGHFAAAGEVLAKSLLMGGVTRRFPNLRVALLEGGVQNGVRLFERYADPSTRDKLDQLEKTLLVGPKMVEPEHRDDFAKMSVEKLEDLRDLFIPHFYFGCEADDPLACIAFDRKLNPVGAQVRAIMSFDLGHWDVSDMNNAAAEAYEQLEDGLIDEDDFRKFGFTHSVQLYGGPNPDFFKGTRIEAEAKAELS